MILYSVENYINDVIFNNTFYFLNYDFNIFGQENHRGNFDFFALMGDGKTKDSRFLVGVNGAELTYRNASHFRLPNTPSGRTLIELFDKSLDETQGKSNQ